MEEKIIVFRRKRNDIISDMKKNNYKRYDDLLDIKLTQFTEEKLKDLKTKIDKYREQLLSLENKSVEMIMLEDIK